MIDTKSKVCLRNASDSTKEVWLDLPFDEDDLNEALQSIDVQLSNDDDDAFDQLANGEEISPGYCICDFESDYLTPEQFEDIFAASDLVDRIEDLDDWEADLLGALMEDGDSLEDAIEECEDGDVDFYPNTNLTDLAEQFGDEEMFTKEFLLQHVDWESVGRELSFDGYTEVAGGVLRRN